MERNGKDPVDKFLTAANLIRDSTKAVQEMVFDPGADTAHIMRAVSLLGRAMVCIGEVGLKRMDWDDARTLRQRMSELERSADKVEMVAIEREVDSK
jgi:hypothetical protein